MVSFVFHRSKDKNIAYLKCKKKIIQCIVGKNGIGKKTREGDYKTPKGVFRPLKVYYRADRVPNFFTLLPKFKIKKRNIWCVDPKSKKYNRFADKPFPGAYELLCRPDSLYDIFIVLDYNLNPVIKYKGSAIFIHCSEKSKIYTEGCIALKKKELLNLLSALTPMSKIIIC